MLKKLAFASLGIALLTPLLASAAQECLELTRTLSRGSTGGDVSSLQIFLISQNHLAEGNVTGYFGPRTQAAVQQFQCAENIICAGTSRDHRLGRRRPPHPRRHQERLMRRRPTASTPPPPTTISCTLSTDDPIIYQG